LRSDSGVALQEPTFRTRFVTSLPVNQFFELSFRNEMSISPFSVSEAPFGLRKRAALPEYVNYNQRHSVLGGRFLS